ncbi:MAG TPA: cytochrome c [Candidatus Acidoferrales bacterium]|nr:cytochrome c [Candidatus Acidoferrales bacterium]
MKRRILTGVCLALLLLLAAGCRTNPSTKTDAQLGLNTQQAAGRRIYNLRCAGCHKAYSSRGSQGPGLEHLFRKKYMPSGLPANDRFVERTIVNGRGMMPAAGYTLSDEELRDLLAYLHTL